MAIEVTVPKLSATMEDARLAKWCRKVGDAVKQGDVLLELETDKSVLEVEATAAGTITELRAKEGDVVNVGAVIAVIGDEAAAPAPTPAAKPAEVARPVAPRLEAASASGLVIVSGNEPMRPLGRPAPVQERAVRATPLARRLAAERGISLDGIVGTGPKNRISSRDIERVSAQTAAAPSPVARVVESVASPAPAPAARPVAVETDGSVSRMRQAIAASVTESRRSIPSFTLDRWINLELLEDARELFNRRLGPDDRLTMTDLLLQSIGEVLARHPKMQVIWQDGPPASLQAAEPGAIGMVVGLDEGVMIPVLKGLDGAGLSDIARQRRQAMAAVRSGRVGAQFAGKPALSVSNIGRVGVDRFEAIISPGETGILAIGRVHQRADVVNGGLRAATGAHFTLSVDHRIIDGLVGGAFLGDLADRIERQTWRL